MPRTAFWRRLVQAAILTGMVATAPAHAEFGDYGEGGWGISSSTLQDMIQADMMNRSLRAVQDAAGISGPSKSKSKPSPPRSPLDVRTALNAGGRYFTRDAGVVKLAALFPRDQFVRRKSALETGIIALGKDAQQRYGVPNLNLATSRVALIAGAYTAYSGQLFPDAYVKPLFDQVAAKMANDPEVGAATPAKKSYDYQIGMGTALLLVGANIELQQAPDPTHRAQLRQIGANTLQSIFGVDASRVRFTTRGYVIQ